jgi:hypothetical protein
MSDNVEDLTELRLWSLEKIKENKAKVARAYNKKVKPKEFQVGDLAHKPEEGNFWWEQVKGHRRGSVLAINSKRLCVLFLSKDPLFSGVGLGMRSS